MTSLGLGMPAVRRDPSAAPSTAGRPDTDALIDRFGRVAHDLRVSITSACSLRCTYCMPAEGLPVIPKNELLSAPEIARLVGIAARDLGVHDVRFTGGEPLTRADLVEIIALSREAAPEASLALIETLPARSTDRLRFPKSVKLFADGAAGLAQPITTTR